MIGTKAANSQLLPDLSKTCKSFAAPESMAVPISVPFFLLQNSSKLFDFQDLQTKIAEAAEIEDTSYDQEARELLTSIFEELEETDAVVDAISERFSNSKLPAAAQSSALKTLK